MSLLNVGAFMATQVRKVSSATSGVIPHVGLIADIVENLGHVFDTENSHKLDIESLINMGMIYYEVNTLSIIIHKIFVFDLPNPRRVRVNNTNKWLYDQDI